MIQQTQRHTSSPAASFLWRWGQFTLGIVALGLGIATMVQAQIGLGPWDVLHQGIARRLDLSIGTVVILLGIPIMLLWIPLGERLGPGTVLNTMFVGTLINVFMGIVPPLTAEAVAPPWLFPAQVAQMTLGVVIMGIGVGLYLSTGLGAGPRDGVMMGLVRRTGWSVRVIRTSMELGALFIGWLLGGTVGVGTLLFAFGIGPVVQATLRVTCRWRDESHEHDT
jgi:uncharacterized membrane protein YczE